MARNLQTHKLLLTKILFKVLLGHTNGCFLQKLLYFYNQNSSEKSLSFHINSKIETFRQGTGFMLVYVSHTSRRQKHDFIYTLQSGRRSSERPSKLLKSPRLFLLLIFLTYGRRSSVRGTTLTRQTHIQKHRKRIIILTAHVAEDRW